MKKLEKILKVVAIVCAIVLIMGTIGTGIGIYKLASGDLSSIGLNKETIDKISQKEPITETYKVSEVKNINIDSSIGSIIVKENTESSDIKVYSTHKNETEMSLSNGELKVNLAKNNFITRRISNIIPFLGSADWDRNVTIWLPKDLSLENLKLSSNMGEVKVYSGGYKSLDVDSNLGAIEVNPNNKILIDKLKTDSSLGEINIRNLDALDIVSKNSSGSTSFEIDNEINIKTQKLYIQNDMGDVRVTMKNVDRDIDIKNNLGSVNFVSKEPLGKNIGVNINASLGSAVNNLTHSDKDLEKKVNMNINSDMGEVKLSH